MTSSAAPVQQQAPATESGETLDRRQRWLLLGLSVAAYAFGHVAAPAVGVFSDIGFGASLLADDHPAAAVVKTAAIVLLVGIAATFLGRSIRPDAGLFAAAVALLAVRRSGGLARNVYLYHPSTNTFFLLIGEALLLAAVLGIVFLVARRLVAMKLIPDDADLDHARPEPEPIGQKLLALATHGLVLAVGMALLCRGDALMQVTASLFICSLAAAWCTVRFIPATPAVFFWLGPILASAVGYTLTAISANPHLPIGEPGGKFAALAFAMPLDYASAGVAGAIYGYWIGRKHLPGDDNKAKAGK